MTYVPNFTSRSYLSKIATTSNEGTTLITTEEAYYVKKVYQVEKEVGVLEDSLDNVYQDVNHDMPAPVWLHCSGCSSKTTGRWFLSSCGKIVCQECHPQLQVLHCTDCQGPCTRTVELDSKAPKEVKDLFSDPSEMIKSLSKVIDFQDKQRASFLSGLSKRLSDVRAQTDDLAGKNMEKRSAIEKTKKRLSQVLKKNAILRKKLRRIRDEKEGGTKRPRQDSGIFSSSNDQPFPLQSHGGNRRHDPRPNLFSTPKKQDPEDTYGVDDGGFLQLKTPGAFQGGKEDQPSLRNPAKKKSDVRDMIRKKKANQPPGFFSPTRFDYDSDSDN